MRNTSGLTRLERKAKRKAEQLRRQKEYVPYWLDGENIGKHGKKYYKLEFNKYGLVPVMDK